MTMTDIESDAIAGTIRNDAGGAKLLQRQKDASEHQYVSDFILSAMSGLCDGPVEFNKERALLELSVVSHLMQTFKGKRRPTVGRWMPWRRCTQPRRSREPRRAWPWIPSNKWSRFHGNGMRGPWAFYRPPRAPWWWPFDRAW